MEQNNTRRGFTLIELLVVVIIIAALAAIAVPQYQKAVMKSRFAALKPIAKAVKDAQEIYFNREGHYAGESELENLDIGIPEGTSLDISATGEHLYVRANNPTGLPHNSYTMYFDRSENYAGNIYCEACDNDANATALCIAEGGTEGPANGNCQLYLLQGNSSGNLASVIEPTERPCSFIPPWEPQKMCAVYDLGNGSWLELYYLSDGSFAAKMHDSDDNLVWQGDYRNANEGCSEGNGCSRDLSLCDQVPALDLCTQ